MLILLIDVMDLLHENGNDVLLIVAYLELDENMRELRAV